jgi:hypothetical protein
MRKGCITRKTTLPTDWTTGAHVGSGGTHAAAASAVAQRKRNLTPILGRRIAVELSRRAGLLAGSGDTVSFRNRILILRRNTAVLTAAAVVDRNTDVGFAIHVGCRRHRICAHTMLIVTRAAHKRALTVRTHRSDIEARTGRAIIGAAAASTHVIQAFATAPATHLAARTSHTRATSTGPGFATVGGVATGAARGATFGNIG